MTRPLLKALPLAAASLAIAVPGAGAATFTVTKLGDGRDGACTAADCSLREALDAANGTVLADEVVLPTGVATLTRANVPYTAPEDSNVQGDLDVARDVTIRGAGAAASTIQSLVQDRVLHVQAGASLTLRDLTVAGGNVDYDSSAYGGGIYDQGGADLALERVVVRDNTLRGAAAPALGAGINKEGGHLVARDVTIRDNKWLQGSGYGGGLLLGGSGSPKADLTNVTITGNVVNNYGAGIMFNNAVLTTLTYVTIVGNTATGAGGNDAGVSTADTGTVRVRSSIIAGNTAPTADCGDFPLVSEGATSARRPAASPPRPTW